MCIRDSVGVDPSMKRRVDELKNSLGKLGDNKIQLNQLLNALRKKQDSEGGLDEAKHELQMKTMRNVIMLEQEINKQKKELEELRCQIGEEKHACIKVSDAAYAGVKLTFGDQCMFLKPVSYTHLDVYKRQVPLNKIAETITKNVGVS